MAKCARIIQLLLECHELNSRRVKIAENVHSSNCEMCNAYMPETVQHRLCECTHFKTRGQLWKVCPAALVSELGVISDEAKCNLILTCLNNTYTKEWNYIYEQILNNIHKPNRDGAVHQNTSDRNHKNIFQ